MKRNQSDIEVVQSSHSRTVRMYYISHIIENEIEINDDPDICKIMKELGIFNIRDEIIQSLLFSDLNPEHRLRFIKELSLDIIAHKPSFTAKGGHYQLLKVLMEIGQHSSQNIIVETIRRHIPATIYCDSFNQQFLNALYGDGLDAVSPASEFLEWYYHPSQSLLRQSIESEVITKTKWFARDEADLIARRTKNDRAIRTKMRRLEKERKAALDAFLQGDEASLIKWQTIFNQERRLEETRRNDRLTLGEKLMNVKNEFLSVE